MTETEEARTLGTASTQAGARVNDQLSRAVEKTLTHLTHSWCFGRPDQDLPYCEICIDGPECYRAGRGHYP